MNFTYHIRRKGFQNGTEEFEIMMVPYGCDKERHHILYSTRDTIEQAREAVKELEGKNVVKTEWVE